MNPKIAIVCLSKAYSDFGDYDIQVTTISDIMKTSDDSSFLQTAILLKN